MTGIALPPHWVTAWAPLVAAVGTVLAFAAAFTQIAVERSHRRRAERRGQAERISAWLFGPDPGDIQAIALHNASPDPVYRAVIWMVFIQGAGPRTGVEAAQFHSDEMPLWVFRKFLSVIPPGTTYTSVPGGFRALSARPGVELAFIDRSGRKWLRSPDGHLSQIRRSPTEYYGLDGPHDWCVPERRPDALGPP